LGGILLNLVGTDIALRRLKNTAIPLEKRFVTDPEEAIAGLPLLHTTPVAGLKLRRILLAGFRLNDATGRAVAAGDLEAGRNTGLMTREFPGDVYQELADALIARGADAKHIQRK